MKSKYKAMLTDVLEEVSNEVFDACIEEIKKKTVGYSPYNNVRFGLETAILAIENLKGKKK